MRECIVSTRPDGGVTITYPAEECIRTLEWGGGVDCHISRWRRGFCYFLLRHHGPFEFARFMFAGDVPLDVAKSWERHKFVNDPRWRVGCARREEIARRWVDGLAHGGLTRQEAILLIADKDVPAQNSAPEVCWVDVLPTRENRNQWRRSHNGGPICVAA